MGSILKYMGRISEHGVFSFVSVWVWHGEPGNMHPYNFETISLTKKSIWANYCKKPQNCRFQDRPTHKLRCVGQFWNEQGTVPCAETFGILSVHKLMTTHPKDQ